jgi:hypothetical protein
MGNGHRILARSVLAIAATGLGQRHRSVKIGLRLLAAVALVVPFSLLGIPGASASTTYELCLKVNNTMCVFTGTHNLPSAITNFETDAQISFINEYTTPNGNAWYELEIMQIGECLNWDPANGYVFDDSCQAGDANELWYNHVAGQLINLAGNEDNDADTYLAPLEGKCLFNGADEACPVAAGTAFYNGWTEIAS